MMDFRFGTAINCIDGRTQEPVIDFMKQKYNIDGVDMLTFPGVDGGYFQWGKFRRNRVYT
jgi:hypothetical protein